MAPLSHGRRQQGAGRAVASLGPGGQSPPPEKYFAPHDEIRLLTLKIVIKKMLKMKS